MQSSSSLTSPPEPRTADRPVLFLHIPKTGGTSLQIALTTLFGDARVRRVALGDADIGAVLGDPATACVNGHVPLHAVSDQLARFELLTVLRHPLARMLSLFRFLHLHGAEELKRYGLQPNFTFAQFADGRGTGLRTQVHNGMVRMLSGDPALSGNGALLDPPAAMLEQALDHAMATLAGGMFGLAEAMDDTLRLLERRWGLPFPLDNTRENTTQGDAGGEDAQMLRRIIERNVYDLALYERAASMFRERLAAIGGGEVAVRDDVVYQPPLGAEVPINRVAGRQGFYLREASGLAWVKPDVPARLYFRTPAPSVRIAMALYAIGERYPVGDIAVRLNGVRLRPRLTPGQARWHVLDLPLAPVAAGLNVLSLEPPFAVPARFVTPGSLDRRDLSVAISGIRFDGP